MNLLKSLLIAATAAFLMASGVARADVIPFADPFILAEDGVYYMYGTSSDKGIAVVVSDDLETWYVPGGKDIHFALNADDSFGSKWFWAPEVFHIGKYYYMYYSAEEHVCVARGNSPLGPFCQDEKNPIIEEKGIDGSLFIDSDGTPYLFWVRFNQGNEIWSAELESDLMHLKKGTESFCISMSQDWEKVWPSVNEGPEVLLKDGKYYLTYSANSYESQDYAIGYATADKIGGEWKKYKKNPVLRRPGTLVGTGHHAFFRDFDGKDRIVFHSHRDREHINPRIIHIGEWKINRRGILSINEKKIMTPSLNRGKAVFTNPVMPVDWPDPTIWEEDGVFYTVATGVGAICSSTDLINWSRVPGPVLSDGARTAASAIGKHFWAPDVVKIGGRWMLYLTCYNSASDCGIAAFSSDSASGPFEYVGLVTHSRETGIQDTIDPEVVFDDNTGKLWLFFGSIGKVHRVELAPDGTSLAPGAEYVHVAGLPVDRDGNRAKVFEGSYLHRHGAFWYLFVSSGYYADSSYTLKVGRSRSLDGVFLDREGNPMTEGSATVVLSSDDNGNFYGPGHNGEIVTDLLGQDYMFYHCHRRASGTGSRFMMLQRLYWDEEGWPYFGTGKPLRWDSAPKIDNNKQ